MKVAQSSLYNHCPPILIAVFYSFLSPVNCAGVPSIKLKTAGYHDELIALPKYEAVVGGKVELPCNLTSLTNDDSTSLILWYQGESGAPIYSIDARNGPLEKAEHFPTEILGSRSYFDVSVRPPVLRIQPIAEGDGGEYRCRVDHRWARTHTTGSLLSVIVPPSDLAILDEKGDHVQAVIGPYNEGSPLQLVCEADGGKPAPAVTWIRDSVVVDDTYLQTDRGVQNELRIDSLRRSDLMTVLTCHAQNNNLTTPLETSVTIDMNLKPVDVQISFFTRPFSAGKEAKVQCKSFGSRPPVRINWTLDGKPIRSAKDSISTSGNMTTTSVLTFMPSASDNEKKLACHAENKKVPNSALTSEKKLTIYHIPQVVLSLSSTGKKQYIMEGSEVQLFCNIKANPSVFDIRWRFQGMPMSNDLTAGILINNQTLVLQKIRRRQKGYYRCLASNVEGTGESDELLLNISYAPICRNRRKLSKGVALQESVRLTCQVDADPPNVTFQWSLNITASNRKIIPYDSDGIISVANYAPRTPADYGTVLCWAKNVIGLQQDPCVFIISRAGPPEQLKNCSTTNYTTVSIQVECQAGYDGGLPQNFYLEVFNSAREKIETNLSRSDYPAFHVTNLPSSTSFILVLYSANEKGKSEAVALSAATKSAPQKRIDTLGASALNPLLGILLGVVVSLVLLAIIIVIIIKLRFKVQEKGPEEEQGTEKSQPLLTKDTQLSSSASEFKDPDVIPCKPDSADFCSLHDNWSNLEVHRENIFTCNGYDRQREFFSQPECSIADCRNVYGTTSFRKPKHRETEMLSSLSPEDLPTATLRRSPYIHGDGVPARYQGEPLQVADMNSTPV